MELKSHQVGLTLALSMFSGLAVLSALFGGSPVSLVLVFGCFALARSAVKPLVGCIMERAHSPSIRFLAEAVAIFEAAFLSYYYCLFLKKTVLTTTPDVALFLLIFLTALALVVMGTASLTSAAHLLTPFVLLFYVGLFLANFELKNGVALPWTVGVELPHKAVAVISVFVLFCVNPLLFTPILYRSMEKKVVEKGIVQGLWMGFLVVGMGLGTSLLTLGQPLAAALDFPFYYAASVARGGSLERFESLVSVVAVVSGVVQIALCGLVVRACESGRAEG